MNDLIRSNKEIKSTLNDKNKKIVAKNWYLINPSVVFLKNDDFRRKLYHIYDKIAIKFNIPIGCIYLTGSAHIGFSLKKGHDFSEKQSDLDIAIINANLFNTILVRVLEETNVYNNGTLFKSLLQVENFQDRVNQGLLHPLYFPTFADFTREWNEFFEELTRESTDYFKKITGCVYLSEECFRINQEISLQKYINIWSKPK